MYAYLRYIVKIVYENGVALLFLGGCWKVSSSCRVEMAYSLDQKVCFVVPKSVKKHKEIIPTFIIHVSTQVCILVDAGYSRVTLIACRD